MPINAFVGRERELAAVGRLLNTARLVTILGPGGIGKTRLGLEAAIQNLDQFPEGAWFADLAAAQTGGVPAAAAAALGLKPGKRHSEESLADEIDSRRMLLFLDNCEHVLDETATLANTLLTACPGLCVLATSREPLGLVGERVWTLAALTTPPQTEDSLGLLSEYESVKVFVDTAKAVRPDFRFNHRSASAVAEICRRMEGMPLGIRLAASRLKSLSADEVLERLGDLLSFQGQAVKHIAERHHSLQAALDWGHDLLTKDEQILFRRLSVFKVGFTLEMAEQICTDKLITSHQVLGLIERLEAKSLLASDTSLTPTRFRMRETPRLHAAGKLEVAGEDAAFKTAHLKWCLKLAEQAEPELIGRDQAQWLARLEQEGENLHAALEYALTSRPGAQPLRLATRLIPFWWLSGRLQEGSRRLEAALTAAPRSAPAALRAKAHWGLGLLVGHTGDLAKAEPAAERALSLYTSADNDAGRARALWLLGLLHLFRQPSVALDWSEQSAAAAEEVGDVWCLAEAFANIGRAQMMLGGPKMAEVNFKRSVGSAEQAGDNRALAAALMGVGWIAMVRGEYETAQAKLNDALNCAGEVGRLEKAECLLFLADLARHKNDFNKARGFLDEGLTMAKSLQSRVLTARSYAGLARLSQAENDLEGAARYFDHAIMIAKESGFSYILVRALQGRSQLSLGEGNRPRAIELIKEALDVARNSSDKEGTAHSLYPLAMFARSDGDDERATAALYEALGIYYEMGTPPGVTACLGALAGLAVVQGRPNIAARLFGLSHSLFGSPGGRFSGFCDCSACRVNDSQVADLKEKMGPVEFELAWTQGSEMSLDEAVAYASRGRGGRANRATSGWASLTRVEREVVALLAEGLTNAEMGHRLFVSPRTVGTHLTHIFDKLDIRSRKEIARAAACRETQ